MAFWQSPSPFVVSFNYDSLSNVVLLALDTFSSASWIQELLGIMDGSVYV